MDVVIVKFRGQHGYTISESRRLIRQHPARGIQFQLGWAKAYPMLLSYTW